MILQIASFNANGLRDISKFKYVVSIMNEKNLDILCCQETFWDNEMCDTIYYRKYLMAQHFIAISIII